MSGAVLVGDLMHKMAIGDHWWRREDGSIWTVEQIYRPDRKALLNKDGYRMLVAFSALQRRRIWIWHPKVTS